MGQDEVRVLGLNSSMLAKTRLRVRGVKMSDLNVLGTVTEDISAGGRKSYQILYVTAETGQLIVSHTCLQSLVCCRMTSPTVEQGGGQGDGGGGREG